MALTDIKVRTVKPGDKPIKLTDGSGMHLLVHPNGSKYWRLQYRFAGKQKMLALGIYPAISLSEARAKREEARKLIANGIDPSQQRKEEKIEQENGKTFEEVARAWHSRKKEWLANHSEKVLRRLEQNLFPVLGNRDITTLKTQDLLLPLKRVEQSGRLEVASRLQQQTTAIMRYAVQNGLTDYNPAQDLTGAIATAKKNHRPALILERLPELLKRIEEYKGRPLTRLAVQLTLLVFIRSSELRFARWSEIDFDKALWTIPAEREALEGIKFSARGSKCGLRTLCH